MKLFSCLSLIVLCLFLPQKNSVIGHYEDHFGNSINISADSTYTHYWDYRICNDCWDYGKWRMDHDTLKLTNIPLYDIIRIAGSKDPLILSWTQDPFVIEDSIIAGFRLNSSGKQNKFPLITKLYFKNNRLYQIDSTGKLSTEKCAAIFCDKKYPTWFMKRK